MYGATYVQETTEKVRVVRLNMKEAQDRQKSYADRRRPELEFQVGDRVYLKMWFYIGDLGARGKDEVEVQEVVRQAGGGDLSYVSGSGEDLQCCGLARSGFVVFVTFGVGI
ncbi:unnamed protein product [Microthlaspi erraticum]|uniref:Reverse transcriptase domain-containing protein n=1 Tax=Microthlaspi erraticum TaxID=1685480 RepID=A0A6D2HPC4_9BRAS|nr:unnamed protein product [Microthlaspi erraticum]